MKFRNITTRATKIEAQMAPMIDVVFLLLIFFLLTLRIVEQEGDFSINMPIGAPAPAQSDELNLPDIKVRLIAQSDGSLGQLLLGERKLGIGPAAFERLNREIRGIVGGSGEPITKDIEVEIDADYHLNYEHFIRAISACTGSLQNGKLVRYVEKIKYAPPRRPPEG